MPIQAAVYANSGSFFPFVFMQILTVVLMSIQAGQLRPIQAAVFLLIHVIVFMPIQTAVYLKFKVPCLGAESGIS